MLIKTVNKQSRVSGVCDRLVVISTAASVTVAVTDGNDNSFILSLSLVMQNYFKNSGVVRPMPRGQGGN